MPNGKSDKESVNKFDVIQVKFQYKRKSIFG